MEARKRGAARAEMESLRSVVGCAFRVRSAATKQTKEKRKLNIQV
jgi:hypothetical protein